jgi:hypothetical protein
MKTTAFAALFRVSTLSVGTAAAQPAPFTAGQFRFSKTDKAQGPTRARIYGDTAILPTAN